jgi:CheY-like chemotaxis protein
MQKMEAIGQLTGGIAHDFNNMLAIIMGSLDLVKRNLGRDMAKVERSVDTALEGTKRAADLTSRLLAFSRQQPLDPKPLDVNKVVSSMSEMLMRTIGETIEVETVLAGGLWRTFADPPQVSNVLINLCINSRDAMPDGGRLTIETSNAYLDDDYAAAHAEVVAGQYILLAVSDTGAGMTPDVIERAFDPFYTTKGAGRGTGLGLSQVYGFIKQSRGHVKIYSEAQHGTTVKVYLPRYVGEGADRDPISASNETPAGSRDQIVLVVEDDERVRRMSVDALQELGYGVLEASGPLAALEYIRTHPRIDLLFTDIVMPDMNGRQLAETARQEKPNLKVLYTTGYTRNAIVHNGMLDPGIALLTKPFSLNQLATKVRQVLDGE